MLHAVSSRFPLAFALLVLGLGGLVACSGQLGDEVAGMPTPPVAPPPTGPLVAPPAPTSSMPPAVADQVRRGTGLYAQVCAVCHGGAGEGTAQAPPVVGPRSLPRNPLPGARMRTGPFGSAKDVGMFIMTKMPPQGPRVPPANVAAILAYLLHQNGATPSQAVSPATAGSMPIHR